MHVVHYVLDGGHIVVCPEFTQDLIQVIAPVFLTLATCWILKFDTYNHSIVLQL